MICAKPDELMHLTLRPIPPKGSLNGCLLPKLPILCMAVSGSYSVGMAETLISSCEQRTD